MMKSQKEKIKREREKVKEGERQNADVQSPSPSSTFCSLASPFITPAALSRLNLCNTHCLQCKRLLKYYRRKDAEYNSKPGLSTTAWWGRGSVETTPTNVASRDERIFFFFSGFQTNTRGA
jgi:hypothetical protein